MASVEYWMLFPAKFLQGLSNTCIWLMCSALIADIWPVSKLGSMIGFVCGLYPLGMSFGLVVGGKYDAY
jgi:MFS family permease